MRFSTKVKLEIEDIGKTWELTYSMPTKKQQKKVEAFAKSLMEPENKKLKAQDKLKTKLSKADSDEQKDALRKELETLTEDMMSVPEFNERVAEYKFGLLVSGADEELTGILKEYPEGFSAGLIEVEKLHTESVAKK